MLNEDELSRIANFCDQNEIVYEIGEGYIDLFENTSKGDCEYYTGDVTLDDVGSLYDWFSSSMDLKIEFIISGGTQYAFRITSIN
jgi:hypothetical protein